jgi:cytochrome c oxidase assembly factor CtaG
LLVYGASILVAAISPLSALALFIAVAVAYVVPGLFNEAPLPRSARSEG